MFRDRKWRREGVGEASGVSLRRAGKGCEIGAGREEGSRKGDARGMRLRGGRQTNLQPNVWVVLLPSSHEVLPPHEQLQPVLQRRISRDIMRPSRAIRVG